ncbi:EAL domain-containing protein [Halomonas denitrificans]|nr:EAL domain-containing protein [Halomonas denitrificans]
MTLRLPLRFVVPLLILAVGAMILTSAWTFELRAMNQSLLAVSDQQLRSNASFIAAEVEAAVRNRNFGEARAALERAIAIPSLRSIHLVDPDGTIRFSSMRALAGKTFTEEPETRQLHLEVPFGPGNSVTVHTDPDRARLVGRFPVQMRAEPGELMPVRSGALYLVHDLSDMLAEHRAALNLRMVRRTVLLVTIAIGFWLLLRRLLLTRIDRLIRTTREVAQGKFDVKFDDRGRDELSDLARELDRMTAGLRDQAEHLSYLADHDAVTGLLNRVGFEAATEVALADARTRRSHFAICLLDIDSLRVINDTQGHLAGDELLRDFAGLLEDALPDALAIARVGGDEFAALIDVDHGEPLDTVGRHIAEHIRAFRFERKGERFGIQASTGIIALTPEIRDSGEALSAADAACYRAKEKQRGSIHIGSADAMRSDLMEGSMRWVSRIHEALDEDRLELHAQRIEAIGDGDHSLHFEVLVRMRDRDGSLIEPSQFLSSAERYNLVGRIDRWVIARTLEWLDRNHDALERIATCSINLSGLSLADPGLLSEVSDRLARHPRIDPAILCFEVTETAAIRNLDQANGFIVRMRRIGCRFALDDFGTGLSSFEYIKRLPVDMIKIDGMFVRDIVTDPVDRAIVKAIHEIASEVGMWTIAEFVESDEILEALRSIGVHFVQGFGIARPVPIDDVLVATANGDDAAPQRRSAD